MSLNDTLAAVLSGIKNAERTAKSEFVTANNSKVIRRILNILNEHMLLGNYEEIDTASGKALKITLLNQINDIGVIKPRFAIKLTDFEKFEKRFLPAKDFGILIVSTTQGLMTHTAAKEKKLGGRLIAYCY